jgi:UDP-N-acetylglucosamine--N-acetylmuramyl-(pentapeptide) pyrophosphoryl-undecaprenol N-acetylglucosamine transferase
MSARRVFIAGGGTGGHLFPGVAVAQALRELEPGLEPAFVSTGRALESQLLAQAGLTLLELKVRAFRGTGLWGKLRSLLALPGALLSARGLIKRHRPALVLAVGGYAAFPLGIMAWLSGVPLVVQEQNAIPGLTNRLLGRLAKVAFVAFDEAVAQFPSGRARLLGNPLRQEVLAQAAQAHRPGEGEEFYLLIMGGSQGAHALNQTMGQALPFLRESKSRLLVIHQTGQADEAELAAAYAQDGFQARVQAFFSNVGECLGLAHLVICRSGASTCSELLAVGRAAVLVPYPFAAGDHQTRNALALANAGAALLVPNAELSGAKVAELVKQFMEQPSRRQEMERRALKLARPSAAQEIARVCLSLMREAA